MLFSSPVFLFLFLPITLLFYFLSPKKIKNIILLIFSVLFYSWGEQELVILLLLSAITDFSCGLIIEKGFKKMGLTVSLLFNLGILLYFKYADFTYSNLNYVLNSLNIDIGDPSRFSHVILPLGISFYTFQTMSYTIDVYRGHVKAIKNLLNFATYVTLFPQLIAGPIVRYKDIASELKDRRTSISQFADGVERFIFGLAKKMIIANNCGYVADELFNLPHSELSWAMAWIGIIAYSFQIYFDFSGYSDMAIGIGKMLGFTFPENFNYPYISKSIREFWRRWHITLSHWFRDYVYISLGGNRISPFRTYINLFLVFLATGLWHGANWTFVIWGLFHGAFIIFEHLGLSKVLSKLPKVVSHLYLFFVITLSWVFFRSDNISEALVYLVTLFSFNTETNFDALMYYLSNEAIIALCLAILFSTPFHKRVIKFVLKPVMANQNVYAISKYFSLLVLFVICYMYITIDSYNPFIYFRF